MLGARIDAQIGHLLAAQTIARQHALHGLGDHALRIGPFEDLSRGARLDPTRITGVPVVWLLALVAGDLHLLGVDHDDIVAHVHRRRERGFVLAAQAHGDDGGKTTQNNALGVDQDPLLVHIRRGRGKGFHGVSRQFGECDWPQDCPQLNVMGEF